MLCKKTTVTYIIICLYYLLSGIEYAVILPTLNNYLLSLGADKFFIGLVMSAFSLTGLLSAPLYGRFTDKTGSTKATVIFSNLFEIGGNFMYFVATSPLMVLGSRLIAGLGSGSGSSIFGMISRSTTKENRTAAFSQLMTLRQLGLIVGPACNLFLRKMDFYIGPFHVSADTVPGLFMALLWFLHELLMIFCYHELPQAAELKNKQAGLVNSDSGDDIDVVVPSSDASQSWSVVFKDLLREEVIVCLAVTFTVMFAQTGIETLLTPLTLQFFNWGELANSIFFCVAGVIIILSFIILIKLSKCVADRQMLIVGMAVMCCLYVVFLFFVIFAVQEPVGTTWVMAIFVFHSVVLVFILPFVWVPQTSIYSKVTNEKTQAFNQGIRLLIMGVGQILGPLWAASLLNNLKIMASVNLTVVFLVTIMVTASYKRLDTSEDSMIEPDEKTPLIRNGSVSINA
uniref:Major facilitator superfamily domain-containing protein 8-like n=1 Tax=Phallusia mammillata TaxID=59560 RepID=A0A6F9DKT0_9ASCI|nr:major facilitator superfamily domain-containing protein 8-like [Phallusia mammillata]